MVGLIEHLLVLFNNVVAPVKNPSVAISTTKPFLEPSFLFQSTTVSSFFSIAFLPSIKIFFKGICDGQSWIYGIGCSNNAVESTNNAVESVNNAVKSTNNGVESTNNAVESVNNGLRSIISGQYVLSREE